MLQYSVQLPPLSLSSRPKTRSTVSQRPISAAGADSAVYPGPTASRRSARISPSPVRAPLPLPLSIPSSYTPSSPSMASSSASPSLSPATPSLPIPRSPYLGSQKLKTVPLPSPSMQVSQVYASRSGESSDHSSFSSSALDVLAPGDKVGEGLPLQGETVRRVPIPQLRSVSGHPTSPSTSEEPVSQFEVVRRLGTGSYAVVYLVREVLYCAQSMSDNGLALDDMDQEDDLAMRSTEYGREYAIKLLSKANLDEEQLAAQMFEATIHQSLPSHPNIVTLHRTLETSSFLLLLLEFVPGEDLFYFLEQSRDHFEPTLPCDVTGSPQLASSPSDSGCSVSSMDSCARTPPTPSLLGSQSPSKLLSRTRLRLIASMFAQMCDAVATCHEAGVFHRDIKPENFIVTDGWTEVTDKDGTVRRERKVVVKLTDFGLSTIDANSADMDCGSAPYMSYECRNNLHPTYSPRAADVWSLGIVLINMLYHYNPWTDTTEGVCPSFTAFRQSSITFFLNRFSGMTLPVSDFLATRVFCILPTAYDDPCRISARQFGIWARDLPNLLAPVVTTPGGHVRTSSITVNLADIQGHRLASVPHSRRPSLRSAAGSRNPSLLATQRASWAHNISRAPSLGPAFEEQETPQVSILSTVPDHEVEDEQDHADNEHEADQEPDSRSASTQKRRKRGARKGKAAAAAAQDQTLETLASASQALAREISKTSRSSVLGPSRLSTSFVPEDIPVSPVHEPVSVPVQATPAPVLHSPTKATITKKPSKWRLGFGKSSSSDSKTSTIPTTPPFSEDVENKPMSSTASNVTNLLMGLNAPASSKASTPKVADQHRPYPPHSQSSFSQSHFSHTSPSANSSMVSLDEQSAWGRGRRTGPASGYRAAHRDVGEGMWGSSTVSAFANTGSAHGSNANGFSSRFNASSTSLSTISTTNSREWQRGASPASTRSGRPLASSSSSISTTSSNWRSSMTSTSSSAFTRYSNGSARSISTAATSVSSSSWRSGNVGASNKSAASAQNRPRLPPNVKLMEGEPWELSELPRQMYINPEQVKFSPPPTTRKPPRKQHKNTSNLDTISERPNVQPRMDASTSTTDLDRVGGSSEGEESASTPRKVQKGQINALAKMLSALRR